MSKYTIRFWPYTALDLRCAEKYLEQKAAKGLMFAGVDVHSLPTVWYEKTEPRKVNFYIDGYKSENYMDQDQKSYDEYLEMAKQAGWIHICSMNNAQYFVSEEGTCPVPLHTQVETEFEALKKPFKKIELPAGIAAIFVLWIFSVLENGSIIKQAVSSISLLTAFVIVGAIIIGELLRYLLFLVKGSKALKSREEMHAQTHMVVKLWGILYNLTILVARCALIMQIIYWGYRLSQDSGSPIGLYCSIAGAISVVMYQVLDMVTIMYSEKLKILREMQKILNVVTIVSVVVLLLSAWFK